MRQYSNDQEVNSTRSDSFDSISSSFDSLSSPEVVFEEVVIVSDVIKAYSLDADGCFLPHCSEKNLNFDFYERNKIFFSQLQEQLKSVYERVFFFVGSARQSSLRDLAGLSQGAHAADYKVSDSYFYALKQAVDKFNELSDRKIELNPLLLDDIAFDRKPGESFEMACKHYGEEWFNFIRSSLNKKNENNESVNFKFFKNQVKEIKYRLFLLKHFDNSVLLDEDPNKFALLYMQIHHLASKYPEQEIEFHFYDDRLDILTSLFSVFSHQSTLIPKNVTVYFHHYVNGSEQCYRNPKSKNNEIGTQSLRGSGLIDYCYSETVKEMFASFEVQKAYDGLVTYTYRSGDPLTHFFDVRHEDKFTRNNFLSNTTVVCNKSPFFEFNERRLARLANHQQSQNGMKTPSLTDFFFFEEKEAKELLQDLGCKNEDRARLTPLRRPTVRESVSFFRDKNLPPNKPFALVCPPEFFLAPHVQ